MSSTINASTASGGGVITTADASGILQLQTAGVTALSIDASQNVGIGTSSPITPLDVVSGSVGIGITLRGRASDNIGLFSFYNNAGTVEYARLQSASSSFGINAILNVAMVFSTNNTERMRIDSSGNLLVGTTGYISSITANTFYTTASQNTVHIVGTVAANVAPLRIQRAASDGDGLTFFYGTAQKGYVSVLSTGTTYNTISDYRLKENVLPMSGALDRVMQLNPVSYVWKDNQKADEGFIAHEVKKIIPSAVAGEKDELDDEGNPRYQGLDQSRIVSVLTAAIQELKAIIDTQSARIEALEAK